jgi:glutamine---fructose-6-phosphate transaminase (isomerizing)
MNRYLSDVLMQPESVRKALAFYEAEGYIEKMNELRKTRFDKVVFAGMGSSHYCNFGAAIHLSSKGINAVAKSAGEILHYDRNSITEKTLLVLVSQSGESGEVVKFLETLPKSVKVVAITNEASSTLGKRGDPTFLLHVASEESVSTRTYLTSWILSGLVARALAGDLDARYLAQIREGVDLLEKLVKSHEEIGARLKAFMPNQRYICYLGRGHSYSTVFGGALFTSELAKYPAMGFDAGEFRHGPFEMVDESYGAMVFAPDGASWDSNVRMAVDIAEHGGKAILVTNRRPAGESKNLLVIEYGRIDEAITPLIDIAAAELFANMVAESKGIEIGKFRWGSKVTTVI